MNSSNQKSIQQRDSTRESVSVIMPVYGHRDYVLSALSSVFAQTVAPLEIIVVNDQSPDDSHEILRPLAESGKIHYILQRNAGPAAARNTGLGVAQGQFIAFLDDDDYWPSNRLEILLREFRTLPSASAIGGRCILFERSPERLKGSETGASNAAVEIPFTKLFERNPFRSPGQVLFRRSAILEIGGFNASIWGADDYEILFRLSRVGPVIGIDAVTLFYRTHATNASRFRYRLNSNTRRAINLNLWQVKAEEKFLVNRSLLRLRFDFILFPYLAAQKDRLKRGSIRSAIPPARVRRIISLFLRRDPSLAIEMLRVFMPQGTFNPAKWLSRGSIQQPEGLA